MAAWSHRLRGGGGYEGVAAGAGGGHQRRRLRCARAAPYHPPRCGAARALRRRKTPRGSHPSSGANSCFSAARLAASISSSPCQNISTGSVLFRSLRSVRSRTMACKAGRDGVVCGRGTSGACASSECARSRAAAGLMDEPASAECGRNTLHGAAHGGAAFRMGRRMRARHSAWGGAARLRQVQGAASADDDAALVALLRLERRHALLERVRRQVLLDLRMRACAQEPHAAG